MLENMVDMHLIAEVKCGNKKAFNALVLKYQYRILKVVGRYVRDHSEMFDVTQETFVKAYLAMDKFRGDSAFYTWLYRIAVNTAKNHAINMGRRIVEIDFEMADMEQFVGKTQEQDYGSPDRILIRDEVESAVFSTLSKLPEDLRTAIVMRELEGKSYEDIAEIMDCPVGTVRSRIFRAREMLDHELHDITGGSTFHQELNYHGHAHQSNITSDRTQQH